MDKIELTFDDQGYGEFSINHGGEKIAEMVISIAGNNMTVYHTEVFPNGQGKGLGKKLLAHMAEYARKNGLNVIPLCPFVHAQFKRRPEEYGDIWNKNGR
jgi:predicted GNAT family acetyltransferase